MKSFEVAIKSLRITSDKEATTIVDLPLLDAVRDIAVAASDQVFDIYHSLFEVTRKVDNSPLTKADLVSHRTIIEGLRRLTPGIPILSEESVSIDFATRASWIRYWLVDPLDGTKDFIKRNGEFTVNIALIERQVSVLGVIVVPATSVSYAAAHNLGAHHYDTNGNITVMRVRAPAPRPWRVVASRSHADQMTKAFICNLGASEQISIGSSLKFCLLAEGRIDIYPRFGPTSEWDTAAAQCVVEEAGGCVTDMDLKPLRYNTKESLLNPYFLAFGDRSIDWRQFMSGIDN